MRQSLKLLWGRGRAGIAPEQLADPDSLFVEVNGLRVHYKLAGRGTPPLVLLHGSFLSVYSWREVMVPLAEHTQVLAFDRPAFGLTERQIPMHDPARRYSAEAQADLTAALLEHLGLDNVVLVGNSTGGTIALLVALRHQQRVQALVLVDAMVYSGYAISEFPPRVHRMLRAMGPVGAWLVRLMIGGLHKTIIRSFWYDKTRVTPDLLAHYRQALRVANWDWALWELILASHALHLDAQLANIRVPTLVISGEHDRTVRVAESVRLAGALPNAGLVIVPNCAHLPHEEQPEVFVRLMKDFIRRTCSGGGGSGAGD